MAPRDHRSCGRAIARARAAGLRAARRAGAAAALAPPILAAPAGAVQLGPDEPHSPNAEEMSTAYWVMLVVTIAIVVLVNAALIGALVRWRERRGRAAARVTAGRGVTAKATAALAALALAIFVFGIVTSERARTIELGGSDGLSAAGARTAQVGVEGLPEGATVPSPPEEEPGQLPESGQAGDDAEPLVVDAIGQQWLWRFEYPSGEREDIATLFSYGELVVPVDTAVVLNVTSTDVIHSWRVPSLGGQVQAIPGSVAQTWFKADEVGVYEGQATVFNGTAYPAMTSRVRVVEPAEYEAHLEQLADDLAEAQESVQEEVGATSAAQAESEEPVAGAEGEGP